MLRSFIAWLDDYLAGAGVSALAKAVVGLMSFSVLLGAVVGDVAVKTGGLVAALLLMTSLGLLLLANQRKLHQTIQLQERQLARYCTLIDEMQGTYHIIKWEQSDVVAANGDTTEYVTIRAKVLCSDLWLFRLTFGCGWPQPPKYRAKVKLRVRNLLIGDIPGASLERTLIWGPDGKVNVIVHLPQPPRVDSEISVALTWIWPGKSAPLMRQRIPDSFTFHFLAPANFARYRVVLPVGCEAYCEPVGFNQGDNGFELYDLADDEGRQQFVFDAVGLGVRRRAGMRLELKEKGARHP